MDPSQIQDFHAHVYFGADTVDRARAVCEAARDRFGLPMGRMHERPVGPHPRWSCQLTVRPEQFGDVMAWLALNRDGLTIFVHPQTGDDLTDHSVHAIWMGELLPLDLSIFKEG
jgi:DOPA 4,5-dioxygenase